MTTGEMYYLLMCVTAFIGFGISLAYNHWSWKQYRANVNSTPGYAGHSAPHVKLAA